MSTRMRVVGWKVQPVLMADDGENLTDVEVQGVMIPASQWQGFKDGGDVTALEQVRQQVEGPPEPPPAPSAGELAGLPRTDLSQSAGSRGATARGDARCGTPLSSSRRTLQPETEQGWAD